MRIDRPDPNQGDTRVVRQFLFFPRTITIWIDGRRFKSTRWLEWASIRQEYGWRDMATKVGPMRRLDWIDKDWVDETICDD